MTPEGACTDARHVVVRLATADDAGLLADMGARTFHETFAADNTAADMAAYLARSFSVDIQAGELADPRSVFLVAAADEEPVGYARLRAGEAPDCVLGAAPLEIARFYSDTSWIGRGVGSALMRACLERAQTFGHDVVWLDVWERNARAIGFYERWGFTVVGGQEFVLGDDVQHDLLMARRLG